VIGISMRQFPRPEGCSRDLVAKKIKSGHLAILPSGTLDPSLVATRWHKTKELEKKAAALVAASPAIAPKFESQAKKEHCLAKLRPLEFEHQSGKQAPITKAFLSPALLISTRFCSSVIAAAS
jgi:hypothetical protein